MEGPEVGTVLLIALSVIGTVKLLTPIVTAFARRVEGAQADQALRQEMDALHERVSEVDALRDRVVELEERLDFAERVLATEDGSRLPALEGERSR